MRNPGCGSFGFAVKKAVTVKAWLTFGFTTLWGIGDLGRGDLVLELETESEYDSNVFLNDSEIGDFLARVGAGIVFQQESSSLANLRARVGAESIRFAELLEQDADNFNAEFDFSYPNNVDRNYYYTVGGSWDQKTRSRREIGKRLKSDRLNARGSLFTSLGNKSGIRFSGMMEEETFASDLYFGSNDVSADLDYLYRYSSKLDMEFGYRYHKLKYEDSNRSRQSGHFLGLGAKGQLTSKVNGYASFGAQYLDARFDLLEGETDLQFYYELDLAWQAGDKTVVSLSGGSDFLSSPTGEINNHRDLSLLFDRTLSHRAKGRAGVTLIDDDYQGDLQRKERAWRVDLNYSLYFSNSASAGATFQYERRNSTLSQFEYDHLKFSIDFSILY